MTKRWFLGAYAGYANFADKLKTSENEALYREGLNSLHHLRGLELPFYQDIHELDGAGLIAWLPRDWEYIVTCLPGTMNALATNPDYGLASVSEFGRKAALERMKKVHERVQEINDRIGKPAVVGIEIHSAPRGERASPEALRKSLEELVSWDFDGAQLILEHCDAWHPDGQFSKGFLSLQTELSTLKDLPIGIGLNWGRSVLEGRRVETIHRHLELADIKLASLFFSGTAIADPLYGNWQDNHAAIRLDSNEPWESTGSLLTQESMEDCKEFIKNPQVKLGLKVQPFPTNLTIEQRLAFLRQQLEAADIALKFQEC